MPEKGYVDRLADWLMGDEKKKSAEEAEKQRLDAEAKAALLKKMFNNDPLTQEKNKMDKSIEDAINGK